LLHCNAHKLLLGLSTTSSRLLTPRYACSVIRSSRCCCCPPQHALPLLLQLPLLAPLLQQLAQLLVPLLPLCFTRHVVLQLPLLAQLAPLWAVEGLQQNAYTA
jgi:hypothetical protein